MSEEEKAFTVSDRRHFTSEGESRGAEDAPAPAPEAASGESPAVASGEFTAQDAGPRAEEEVPHDLVGLFVSFATQATLFLTGDPEAPENERAPDLAAARGIITLLETLKAKTEGNRTPEEDGILEGVLYQLRMGYVARSKAGGA